MKIINYLGLAALLTACGTHAQPCAKAPAAVNAATSQTIEVSSAAPEFSIRLDANPTTGYRWTVKSYDSALLTLVKNEYLPPGSNCIGAGGEEIWTFKANAAAFTKPTKTLIEMEYARSWEQQGGTTVTYTVMTKP